MNDLSNFDGIFWNVTYDNIKCHKKARLHSFYIKYIFEKNTQGSN